MGENQAGQNTSLILLAGFTILTSILLHFIYKLIFGGKKKEAPRAAECDQNAPADQSSEAPATEGRTSGKTKKRAPWKGKTDFSHPWLLKNLKGHPGTILHMDFSANGKFMAVTCDEAVTNMVPVVVDERRRRPRDRRHAQAPPPTTPPPRRIAAEELAEKLRPHLLSPERMWAMGYPMEIEPNSCKAVAYIDPPPRARRFTSWDVNAPEFVPGGSPGDSGVGSLGSTPRSDSDEEVDVLEHSCVRCDRVFHISRDGEYLTEEPCVHHWGRIGPEGVHSCCRSPRDSRGCTTSRFHVWNGTKIGMNGPLEGYVRARTPRGGVYSLDAEMCYTIAGLELASIAVVAADGRLVYKALVKPTTTVLDYNTRFSGIRPRDLARATKTLRDVQNDILGFVGTDTILMGHSLDNDLRALKLLHGAVVDTSALYPHRRGFPLRRSLRVLAADHLGRSVQASSAGHSALEDARTVLDLVLLKMHEEEAACPRLARTPPSYEPYDPLVKPPSYNL